MSWTLGTGCPDTLNVRLTFVTGSYNITARICQTGCPIHTILVHRNFYLFFEMFFLLLCVQLTDLLSLSELTSRTVALDSRSSICFTVSIGLCLLQNWMSYWTILIRFETCPCSVCTHITNTFVYSSSIVDIFSSFCISPISLCGVLYTSTYYRPIRHVCLRTCEPCHWRTLQVYDCIELVRLILSRLHEYTLLVALCQHCYKAIIIIIIIIEGYRPTLISATGVTSDVLSKFCSSIASWFLANV